MASVEIDEQWVMEYLTYGFSLIAQTLTNHAAFDQWLAKHGHPRECDPHPRRKKVKCPTSTRHS